MSREARTIRFEFRLSYEESKTLNRIAAKLGEADASKALRRLMAMYEAGELERDHVKEAMRSVLDERESEAKANMERWIAYGKSLVK